MSLSARQIALVTERIGPGYLLLPEYAKLKKISRDKVRYQGEAGSIVMPDGSNAYVRFGGRIFVHEYGVILTKPKRINRAFVKWGRAEKENANNATK